MLQLPRAQDSLPLVGNLAAHPRRLRDRQRVLDRRATEHNQRPPKYHYRIRAEPLFLLNAFPLDHIGHRISQDFQLGVHHHVALPRHSQHAQVADSCNAS